MKQSKTTLKELTAAYRAVLRHGILCNAIALGLLVTAPAMADYTWAHPENIDSYAIINGDINHYVSGGTYNFITGTAMRNVVNGNVNLVLDDVTQSETTGDYFGVYGNMFLKSVEIKNIVGATVPSEEQKALRQYINGDVSVDVKNSTVDRNVVGDQFYIKAPDEINGDIGLSGKTTVTVSNSVIKGDVRGANIGDVKSNTDAKISNLKVGDIELNIDNSLVEDEVVSIGAYVPSAGNVKINVTGNSIIGYDATDNTKKAQGEDGWIIAGAQRNGSYVGNTEINLDTKGLIRIAGHVNAGSRERSSDNTDEDSVRGKAILNMLGGGDIEIGGDVRAYHVAGETTLNLADIDATVGGTVKEFQTINMDENSKLTANKLVMTEDDVINLVLADEDKYSQIKVGTLDANNATLNMTVRNAGTYNVVDAESVASDFTWNRQNAVFDLFEDDGIVTATVKSAEDIAGDTGITNEAAQAISHVAQAESKQLQDLSIKLQEKLAEAESNPAAKEVVEHATRAIHPETESVAQSVSTSVQNTIVNLASSRMAAPIVGRNGGDAKLTSGGVWAQGLYNRSKQADAFNGYTRGIALGLDGTINKRWTIGAGYSFAHSDISGSARNTEIDSNTVFVYGQYKPAEWYVNAIANYTSSDYSEKGTVIDNTPIFADYSVKSYGGNVATGYNFNTGITPELGLRYIHVTADDYTNSFGVKTHMDNTNFLTGILGAKYAFNVVAGKYTTFMPQLNAGFKYDLLSDKNIATVTMPGINSYTMDGERLSRIGGEFGIGLGMKYRNLDIALNYDIDVRNNYTSQTGMLKFRCNF